MRFYHLVNYVISTPPGDLGGDCWNHLRVLQWMDSYHLSGMYCPDIKGLTGVLSRYQRFDRCAVQISKV